MNEVEGDHMYFLAGQRVTGRNSPDGGSDFLFFSSLSPFFLSVSPLCSLSFHSSQVHTCESAMGATTGHGGAVACDGGRGGKEGGRRSLAGRR